MKKSSSGQMWIYREFRRVETEREAVSEWTSEGGFERENSQVEADGTPPVIHRGTYDGTCKRVDIFTNVNLGGIAEVYNAFVPCIWGKGVFRIPGGVERMILSSRQSAPARRAVTSAI